MKKVLLILAIICTQFITAQIRVTPEGYAKMGATPAETTLSNTDTLLVKKVDGIVRGISLFDFKGLLPVGGGGSASTIPWDSITGIPVNLDLDGTDDIIKGLNSITNNFEIIKPGTGYISITDNSLGIEHSSSLGLSIYTPSDGNSEDGNVALISEENGIGSQFLVYPDQIRASVEGNFRFELQNEAGVVARTLIIDSVYNNNSDIPTKFDVDTAISEALNNAGTDDQTLSYVNGDITIEDGNSIEVTDATLPAPYTASNYTRTSALLRGHLQGIDNALGSITGGGTDDQNASEVPYDNTTSGLTATDVQGALTELSVADGDNAKKSENNTYSASNTFNGSTNFNNSVDFSNGTLAFFANDTAIDSVVFNVINGQGADQLSQLVFKTNDILYGSDTKGFDSLISGGSGTIADNSVTSAKIANGAIINEDIADNTIEARKLVDATIVGSKIANGAVDSDRILNGTIAEEDLSAAVQTKLNTVASGTDSGQSMSLQIKTDVTETFNNADVVNAGTATDKRKFTTFTGTNEITLDDTITLYNQPFLLFHKSATGSTTLKKGTGTTFIISDQGELAEDGVTFTDYANASVIALSSNEYLIACSTCSTYTDRSPLFIDNAATPSPYEVDDVGGIVSHLGSSIIRSSSTGATNGSYRIELESDDVDGETITLYIPFTAELGESYLIEFDAEEVVGSAGNALTRTDTGFDSLSSVSFSGTGMQPYSFTTGAATQTNVNLRIGMTTASDNGDIIAFDNLRITKVE